MIDPVQMTPEFWLDPFDPRAPVRGWNAVLGKKLVRPSNGVPIPTQGPTALPRSTAPTTAAAPTKKVMSPARKAAQVPGNGTLLAGTHQGWMAAFVLLTLVFFALYVAQPPGESHWSGLLFGLGGTGLALFCGLLPVRKRLLRISRCRHWPIVRSSVWETGHIYSGLLSWLVLQFHGRFRMGGPRTSILLVVLWVIIGSGLTGLLFGQLLVLTKAAREGKGRRAARIIATGHFLTLRVHIPLTLTLLLLGAAHAVMAFFY